MFGVIFSVEPKGLKKINKFTGDSGIYAETLYNNAVIVAVFVIVGVWTIVRL